MLSWTDVEELAARVRGLGAGRFSSRIRIALGSSHRQKLESRLEGFTRVDDARAGYTLGRVPDNF